MCSVFYTTDNNNLPEVGTIILIKGGFPDIAEITRCHTFTKEINHARARSQYFNENFCCENCLRVFLPSQENRKNDLILIMTPEKQDKTLELSKHWSVDSTPARNEVIMKRTYPVKSVKCDKICSNY